MTMGSGDTSNIGMTAKGKSQFKDAVDVSEHNMKEFVNNAVQEHLPWIENKTKGYDVIHKMVEELTLADILPKNTVPEIGTVKLAKEQSITDGETISRDELNEEWGRRISDVADRLETSDSNVIRLCIFREMWLIASSKKNPFSRAEVKRIGTAWALTETDIEYFRKEFYNVLENRFDIGIVQVESVLKAHVPLGYKGFAETYANDFYGTDLYNHMREKYNERAFNNAEMLIQEYTDNAMEVDGETNQL